MASKQARTPLAPRKTPTQRRSADTVDAIIEAAARILEEQGFKGYSTNAVALRAGVSIGSLYQYFPGKDALTSALIERETAVLLAHIGTATHASDWATGLRAMISAAVAHQLQRPRLARLLDIEENGCRSNRAITVYPIWFKRRSSGCCVGIRLGLLPICRSWRSTSWPWSEV